MTMVAPAQQPPVNAGASAAAIQAHYDVGNEFYSIWLDPTHTYSCALWEGDDDTLERSQLRKIDYLIQLANASRKLRVLDIGCGWGSTMRRLLDQHDVAQVIGVTLSAQQYDYVKAQGDSRIDVRLCDWRELALSEPVDAIISIGAFEHFARVDVSTEEKRATYRHFFESCHRWLKPGGSIGLQTISYENSRREDFNEFFRTEIFPESDLPTVADVATACERLFEVRSLRSDREHYARTTRAWLEQLRKRRDEAVGCAGEPVVARFEHYLKLATLGFHTGRMGLLRFGLRRVDTPAS